GAGGRFEPLAVGPIRRTRDDRVDGGGPPASRLEPGPRRMAGPHCAQGRPRDHTDADRLSPGARYRRALPDAPGAQAVRYLPRQQQPDLGRRDASFRLPGGLGRGRALAHGRPLARPALARVPPARDLPDDPPALSSLLSCAGAGPAQPPTAPGPAVRGPEPSALGLDSRERTAADPQGDRRGRGSRWAHTSRPALPHPGAPGRAIGGGRDDPRVHLLLER